MTPSNRSASRLKLIAAPVYRGARRTRHRLALSVTAKPLIAHQGLQRSGTNLLAVLLSDAGLSVVNGVDPPRRSPRHKHFRWQPEKAAITMHPLFSNDLLADSVDDINRAAGWSSDVPHIVIFRRPESWIDGIVRWGLTHDWLDPAEAQPGTSTMRGWMQEWSDYYRYWSSLASRQSDRVALICLEDLVRAPREVLSPAIRNVGLESAAIRSDVGTVRKVRHSKPNGSAARQEKKEVSTLGAWAITATDWDWQAWTNRIAEP